jgi:hypothetical protein
LWGALGAGTAPSALGGAAELGDVFGRVVVGVEQRLLPRTGRRIRGAKRGVDTAGAVYDARADELFSCCGYSSGADFQGRQTRVCDISYT